MNNYKTELLKIIAEEVVKLSDAVYDDTPVDHYAGYDVLNGFVRERYGGT